MKYRICVSVIEIIIISSHTTLVHKLNTGTDEYRICGVSAIEIIIISNQTALLITKYCEIQNMCVSVIEIIIISSHTTLVHKLNTGTVEYRICGVSAIEILIISNQTTLLITKYCEIQNMWCVCHRDNYYLKPYNTCS